MTDNETVEDGGGSAVDEMAKLLGGEAEPETEEPEADEVEVESEEEPEEAEEASEETGEYDLEQKIAVNLDGKEVEVALKDLIKGYHRGVNYERKAESLKVEREAFTSKSAELKELERKYSDGVMKIEEFLSQNAEFSNIDWVKLAEEDPAEWARQKQRKENHDALLNRAKSEREKLSQAFSQEEQGKLMAYAQEQHEKLFSAMPELKTEQSMRSWHSYMTEAVGFTPEQIANAPLDHRIVMAFEKARRYDEAQKKGAEKHPTKAPKLLRPGASKSKAPEKQAQMVKRAAKTGNPRDAAAALAELWSK